MKTAIGAFAFILGFGVVGVSYIGVNYGSKVSTEDAGLHEDSGVSSRAKGNDEVVRATTTKEIPTLAPPDPNQVKSEAKREIVSVMKRSVVVPVTKQWMKWMTDSGIMVQKATIGAIADVFQAPAASSSAPQTRNKEPLPVPDVPVGQETAESAFTQDQVIQVQQLPNPVTAVQLALQDATSISPSIAKQRRYLWCPNASKEEYSAAAFTINSALSQSSVDVIPIPLANGSLIAVDLKLCAPDDAQYHQLVTLWEKYGHEEPYFHVPGRFQTKVKPYKGKDGKTYDTEWKDGYVRAPYLGQSIIDLETATGSYTPILRIDQWLVRSLDTVDNGLYYELRGLEVGKTKLDGYLISRGASREQAKRTRADEKAILMSEVTDKARVVTMFPTASTRLSVGLGMAAITDDPFDETDQADFDPFRNFLESKTNGHEVFVTLPSGWIEYSLWNADGDLVKEAPPNLVADHRIPEPHTRRLQGAIACIRCHASADMWQPFTNEVAAMLSNQGANVFGDLKGGKKQDDTLQRLAGLYSGDLSEVLTLARNAFARRVFAVCRMEVTEAAGAVAKVYNDYVYTRITAKTACRELGIMVADEDGLGVNTFKVAVPPLPALDDPVIGRLQVSFLDVNRKSMRGLTLTRRQWEQVYADTFTRMLSAKNQGLAKAVKENQ